MGDCTTVDGGVVVTQVSKLLSGNLVVGHSLFHDLEMLPGISVNAHMIRDTLPSSKDRAHGYVVEPCLRKDPWI
jgi:hypothetical protein